MSSSGFAALAVALGFLASGPAAACMSETAAREAAQGRIAIRAAKDAAGRSERPYILTVPTPVCLTASDPENSVKGTRTIHVCPATPKLHEAMQRLVGKTVEVRGTVFAAHTAHHHAPIVMEVAEIKGR